MFASLDKSRALPALILIDLLGLLVLGWMLFKGSDTSSCKDSSDNECPLNVVLEEVAADVRHGATRPELRIDLILDPWSDAARQVFRELTYSLAAGHFGAAELRLFLAPTDDCEADEPSLSCLAARLVVCAESAAPGSGIWSMGDLFDARWRGATADALFSVTQHRLAQVGHLGPSRLTGSAEVRADVAGGETVVVAMERCVHESREVRERIAEHQNIARRVGVRDGVGGVAVWLGPQRRYAAFGSWITPSSLRRLSTCLSNGCEGNE